MRRPRIAEEVVRRQCVAMLEMTHSNSDAADALAGKGRADVQPAGRDAVEHGFSQDSFELIQRHRAGDAQALGVLVQRYHSTIERIVCVRMGSALLAVTTIADVVQSTLVRVVKDIAQYEPKGDARWIAWVAQLAQREIQNQARAQRARKRCPGIVGENRQQAEFTIERTPDTATGVSSAAEKHELRELLDRTVRELPGAQREVIVLRHYANADWTLVAERMGRSIEACQELGRRARVALAKRMRPPR